MMYTSTNWLFRSLSDKEEEEFREHARDNPPTSDNWALYHPVCCEEWRKQGLFEGGER
jgi:hypothetical protein